MHACEIMSGLEGWKLERVVANNPEPGWDIKLSESVASRWPDVELRKSGRWEDLLGENYDLVLSVLYDRVIGQSLIDQCGLILNCHLGKLPEYRGVRPANWALKNRETVHGVTIHVVDRVVDAGAIAAQVVFPIWPEVDEVRDVWMRSRDYAQILLRDTLSRIQHLQFAVQEQKLAKTYFSAQDAQLGDRRGWTREIARDH